MKTARYALAAAIFLIPALWLAMLLGCVRFGQVEACRPVNYAAAPLAVGVLVLAPLGLVYLERARRRARKGMWMRAAAGGPGWGRWFERTVRVVWGSEEEPPPIIAGELRYQRRRWLIPCPNGQTVSVDRARFWRWLEAVDTLQRTLPPGQSAVAIRRWKGKKFEGLKLSEGDVLAFREILKVVKAVDYRTRDPRSMYYVAGEGAVWGRVEEYERLQASEPY